MISHIWDQYHIVFIGLNHTQWVKIVQDVYNKRQESWCPFKILPTISCKQAKEFKKFDFFF